MGADYIISSFNFGNRDLRNNSVLIENFFLDNQYFVINRTQGIALHADFTINNFNIGGDYVTALDQVNPVTNTNSQISAWGVTGTVNFSAFNYPSYLTLSYQGSKETDIFGKVIIPAGAPIPFDIILGSILPETRYQIGVGTEIMHNMSVALQWIIDQDFEANQGGGSGKYSNLITARLSAQL
jgi:hypothetical protein